MRMKEDITMANPTLVANGIDVSLEPIHRLLIKNHGLMAHHRLLKSTPR